ncbi:ABC transporter substrate-binding protein [Pararhizobium sp. DWP3-4]|uniref:ABC transporter substrate-binding protein n=1 Tax=Pararhizobium sp. DWP3-4 TaxID=2804565 RepID=UPI003CE959F2
MLLHLQRSPAASRGRLLPGLATAWEQTSPTTWRFKLRAGVKFQDGTPFNAAAVANALARAQNEALPIQVARQKRSTFCVRSPLCISPSL